MWIINICPYKARSRMFLPWILHWKGFIGLTKTLSCAWLDAWWSWMVMKSLLTNESSEWVEADQSQAWKPTLHPILLMILLFAWHLTLGVWWPRCLCTNVCLYHPSFYPWRLFTYKATIAWTLRVARYVIKLSLGKQKSFTRHHLYVGLLYNIVH